MGTIKIPNEVKDVKKVKIEYSKEYLKERDEITKKIEEDKNEQAMSEYKAQFYIAGPCDIQDEAVKKMMKTLYK